MTDPKSETSTTAPEPELEAAADAIPPQPDATTEPAQASEPLAEPDVLLATILRDLKGEPELPPEAIPAPEPEVEPVPAVAAEPLVQAPPPHKPADPVKKNLVTKSITKGHPLVDGLVSPDPVPVPAPVQVSAPADYTAQQREEIEDAMVAERLFPDRYQGHSESLKKWYATFDSRAQSIRDRNPNLSEEDDEYQALLKTKPTLSQPDYINVAAKKATDRQMAEIAPTIKRIKMEAKKASILPQVAEFVQNNFRQQISNLVSADPHSSLAEAHRLSMEKGPESAMSEYPLEVGMMREAAAHQMKLAQEFLLLRNGAEEFDSKNATHIQIADFINREGALFQEKGGKYLRQGNKTFLPRSEFISMLSRDPSESSSFDATKWQTQKYWTFTDSSIIDMMAVRTKESAEKNIESVKNNARKYGFEKAPKKEIAIPQTPPPKKVTEIRPPQSRPAASPGAATTPKSPAFVDNSPVPISSIVSHLKMVK